MSAATARVAAPAARPAAAPRTAPAPRLRLVRPPEQARLRVPFVLACMGVLAVALVAALLLNTSMAQAAFATSARQSTLSTLDQDADDLQTKIDEASSPERLAASARALGMVPATGTGWIRLSDGTVAGAPAPAAP
jgi:hypothetical protein